jgi:membrane protease YdiL (CAAX protease family)
MTKQFDVDRPFFFFVLIVPILYLLEWFTLRAAVDSLLTLGALRWFRANEISLRSLFCRPSHLPMQDIGAMSLGYTLYSSGITFLIHSILVVFGVDASVWNYLIEINIRAVIEATVVAPILEEIFFRGFLLLYLSRGLNSWKPIILSSLLFGLVHGAYGVIVQSVFGIFACILFIRTRSLLPCIFLHFLTNTLLLPIESSLTLNNWWVANVGTNLLPAILLLVGSIPLFWSIGTRHLVVLFDSVELLSLRLLHLKSTR